jgi:hypothetical protein
MILRHWSYDQKKVPLLSCLGSQHTLVIGLPLHAADKSRQASPIVPYKAAVNLNMVHNTELCRWDPSKPQLENEIQRPFLARCFGAAESPSCKNVAANVTLAPANGPLHPFVHNKVKKNRWTERYIIIV